MDYITKPVSRHNLRKYAAFIRKHYRVPESDAFPVLDVLERLADDFKNCNYTILEDNKLPPKTMAQCLANDIGGYTIEIKQSVYDGAYLNGTGAFLGFICHEICHILLFKMGFTPIFERSFGDKKIKAYRSVEWQTKALCGELMIPYQESIGMSTSEIVSAYNCSTAFAKYRIDLDNKTLRF